MDTVLRRASCQRTINLDLPAPGIHTSFSLRSLEHHAEHRYLRAEPGPACRSSTHYAHMSAPIDYFEWGDASKHNFPGVPPSDVVLLYDYRIAKYSCGVCGTKSKRWSESAFYYCPHPGCQYKVCEQCLVDRPDWFRHKCPPASPAP